MVVKVGMLHYIVGKDAQDEETGARKKSLSRPIVVLSNGPNWQIWDGQHQLFAGMALRTYEAALKQAKLHLRRRGGTAYKRPKVLSA